MKIKTDRLNFKQVSIEDLNKIHALHSLPETDQFNILGIPQTINETEKIINDWIYKQNTIPPTSYIFCVEVIDSKQFIGLIALNLGKPQYKSAEVWYKIHSNFWGKGYATEALLKLLHFAFDDLRLHRIEAGCAVENIASIRVLERAGLKREGLKRKILPIRGEWKDNYFYAILEEDFDAIRVKTPGDISNRHH